MHRLQYIYVQDILYIVSGLFILSVPGVLPAFREGASLCTI